MKSFDIGLSALRTHQQSLATMGHNIANASTPGYTRQRAELINRPPASSDPLQIGSGVDVSRISRLRDTAVESALLRNASVGGYTTQTLDIATQIETFLLPGDTSIHTSLSDFFNRLEKVANAPQDLTVRREFLSSADDMVAGFNNLDRALAELDIETGNALQDGLTRANQLIRDIADLNVKIFEVRSRQKEPNDLLDRRDRLVTELSGYLDVETHTDQSGREQVVLAGGTLGFGHNPIQLELAEQTDGSLALRRRGGTVILPLSAGKFRALLEASNEIIPERRRQVSELASLIVRELDQQHAQGVPDSGAFGLMVGQRGVSNVTASLQEASALPVTSGSLYVTITDTATGARRTERLDIDVSVDSLDSIAQQLNNLVGMAATVDPERRTLSLHAQSGYAFDFAGRPDNVPDLTAFSGTAVPEFSGSYSGRQNDQWTVSFSGPGTVGLTPGLTATIRNSNGQILATHVVGEGYEAGQPLLIQDGMTLKLASGTISPGDEFSLHVVTDADEVGLLSALGLNSMFSGSVIGEYRVADELMKDPSGLAGSLTGTTGDATNFARLAAIRDLRFDATGGRTMTEELAELTADTGLSVQSAENQRIQTEFLQQQLMSSRDAVSGVDINEEMLKMLEVERAYQAATRFISTVNATLDELFRLVQ